MTPLNENINKNINKNIKENIDEKVNAGHQLTQRFEGFEPNIYADSKGIKTVGYGFNIQDPTISKLINPDVLSGKRPMNRPEADIAFKKLYNRATSDAKYYAGEETFEALAPKQKRILTDMAYNLGLTSLMGFKKMRKALKSGNSAEVIAEMKDSDWFNEVGNRSKHHYNNWMRKTNAP